MPRIAFFTFFSVVLLLCLTACFQIYDSSYAQDESSFSNVSYVDSSMNASFYIILEEVSILHIQLQVSNWGKSESSTAGLLISIYDDMNDSIPIASWLLIAGDNGKHHYQTELSSSIALIVFSSYHVKFATFTYSITNVKALWTYRNTISNNDSYFIIERSSKTNTVISTMILRLYPVVIIHNITIIINIRVGLQHITSALVEFSSNDTIQDIELEANFHRYVEGQWYSIDFEILGDYSSVLPNSILNFELYYEKADIERIVRIFTNQPTTLPVLIDNDHKDSNWTPSDTVEDTASNTTVITPVHDSGFDFSSIFISLFIVVYIFSPIFITIGIFHVIAIIVTIFIVIRRRKYRKHKKIQPAVSLSPKTSVKNLSKPAAVYKPKPHIIKPTEENTSYELQTTHPKTVTCAVCYQTIKEDRELIRCPVCDVAFHKHHLYEWVKSTGICPICKAKLSLKELNKQKN